MVGRELGHIAAGHTRFHSLLSVNGNENPIISMIFGAWLRRCALTCDKVGLLCCGSMDAAIRGMGIAAFHEFGRKVDYEAFAEQHAEVQADTVLRWGESLSSEPYATHRIASLRTFMSSHAYAKAEEWFLRERDEEPPALAAPGEIHVAPRDCAGWWRRSRHGDRRRRRHGDHHLVWWERRSARAAKPADTVTLPSRFRRATLRWDQFRFKGKNTRRLHDDCTLADAARRSDDRTCDARQ